MRRLLITLLAVVTLLSQWGWLEHGYHEHDPGEVCEVCLSANGHGQAITPSLPALPAITAITLHNEPLPTQPLTRGAFRLYASRAPPRLL